ncbi:MAG TPA: helix-turn-helix domain-containing protein [Polyangiaceae bacterium]|nr:helix-turn-helix domain-containing protein [Polyangiaceae bacterium]
MMDLEHFGTFLRKQREARGLSLTELSRATKIKESNLVALEDARLDALPARVFVVGYVGAYARAVGADVGEAMSRLELVSPACMIEIGECMPKVVARAPQAYDETSGGGGGLHERRRVGVALVVFLLLIVATLTLSLLLRHGGHVGGPIS